MKSQSYYSLHRREMLQFLPLNYLRVLEVGCGEGSFRFNLDTSCEYWAIEANDVSAKLASKIIYKVFHGKYEEVYEQLPDNYFDLVICNDVIEHMCDHEHFLISVKKKMTKESCLVGSVPNIRHIHALTELLFRKDWRYVEQGIFDKTHLRFFTEKSLKTVFSNCGWSIENLKGINPQSYEDNLLKKTLALILVLTFGKDVRFVQFGFCIKPNFDSLFSLDCFPG